MEKNKNINFDIFNEDFQPEILNVISNNNYQYNQYIH
jgi:hypothetical protein